MIQAISILIVMLAAATAAAEVRLPSGAEQFGFTDYQGNNIAVVDAAGAFLFFL